MTWEEIRKRFLEELVSAEDKLKEDLSAFARRFIEKLKREGYRLTPELEQELNNYVRSHEAFLRRLIEVSAAKVAIGLQMSRSMRDEFVAQIAEEVFRRRWADGKNLSERIWWINDEIRRGMTEVLAQGIRTGAAVNRVVYEMQYMIEREMGARFVQVTTERLPKWLDDLWEAGKGLIRNPETRKVWEETVRRVEEHLEQLSREGTYHATRRLLAEMIRAVEAGREDLMLKALNWWLYDRQLYFLKRVARTEAANAFHLAQIRATEDDPDVIGYQWRLSRSHPRPDICDWYASVDFGLGKGVWPKDRVPRAKAHPHCMCYLLPRVTKGKRHGAESFKDFWEGLPEADRRELTPKWAWRLNRAGVPVERLLKPDGSGFLSRKEWLAQEDRILRELGLKGRIGSLKLEEATERAIQRIFKETGNRFEACVILDQHGQELFFKKGEKKQILFDPETEIPKMMGARRFIHNHPSGWSLSFEDVRFMLRCKIHEMVAVSEEFEYYVRKSTDIPSTKDLEAAFRTAYIEGEKVYRKALSEGLPEKEAYHRAVEWACKKVGLDYERRRR